MQDKIKFYAAAVFLIVIGIGVGTYGLWIVGRLNAIESSQNGMAAELSQKILPNIQKELEALKPAAPVKK